MKNFIFLSAMAAVSLSASAQYQQVAVQANTLDSTKGLKVMTAASASLQASKAPAQRSVEDGVLYGRPAGAYHSAYTFGGPDGSTIPALLMPGLAKVTYPNLCPNPGVAVWTGQGEEGEIDLSKYADVDNNLVMTWGINPYLDTQNYILTGFVSPTITVGGSSFSAPEIAAVANDVTPVMNFSPLNDQVYMGFSDGPAFGSNSVLETSLINQGAGVAIGGTVEFFDKPASPMYTEAFQLPFTSYQADPLNGKTLTLTLNTYEYVDGEGYKLLEKKEELTCSSVDIQGSQKDQDGEEFWYGYVTFYKETLNEFGDAVVDPFVIDYAYATKIEGYNQDGVDVSFRLVCVEDPYQMKITRPTRFEAIGEDGSKGYYFFGTEEIFYKTFMYTHCFFDGVEPAAEEYASIQFSTDGKECTTDHPSITGEAVADFIPVITAAPIYQYDENGEAVGFNYDLEDCPDWLTVGATDEVRETNGFSALVFECEPLPEGVEGRYADIYLVGRGGVKNAKPFRVRQGTVAGISNVTLEGNADAALYNAAGQRVSKANGFVIKGGKKMIMK